MTTGRLDWATSVRESYDAVASTYAARLSDELDGKPLDRSLLDEVAAGAIGTVCDLGCGPGHVAAYLRDRGARVCGIDLSPEMVAVARRRHPGIRFEVGDLRSLAAGEGSFAAVAAMYSLIHLTRSRLAEAAVELARVLAPGGRLLASFHRGAGTVHLDDWWEHRVDLDFHFFEPADVERALAAGGFEVERVVEREPYPDIEVQTRRFYVLASRSLHA